MKAVIYKDQKTIELPVALGTPVFIIEYNQHDGYYVYLVEYGLQHISREVYITRKDAETAIARGGTNAKD